GLVEGPLHQPLEPPLEPLESHAESVPSSPCDQPAPAAIRTSVSSPSHMGVNRRMFAGWVRGLPCRTPGEWRNWQTRRLQVPVSERMWGFKSPLAHRSEAGAVRAWMSWSSGKDSALALHPAREVLGLEVTRLRVSLTADAERVSMHAVRAELLELQADRLGIPVH